RSGADRPRTLAVAESDRTCSRIDHTASIPSRGFPPARFSTVSLPIAHDARRARLLVQGTSSERRGDRNEDRRRRAGRIRTEASRWVEEHGRRRGREPGGQEPRVDREGRRAVRYSALDDEPRRGPRAAGRRGRDHRVTDPVARQAGDPGDAGRQACRDRDPDRRLACGRRGDPRGAAGNRSRRDGGAYAALQPVAPVGAQPHRGRRAEAPAPRRADLLLPPQEHQSRRQAAQLDGSSAVASRLPHRGSVPLSDGRGTVERLRARRAEAPGARDRDGHEHRHDDAFGRGLHAGPLVQQRGAAGHVLPLHLRQRHVYRALRRSLRRQRQADRPDRRRRLDERHRAARSRVHLRDPREARAERERRAGAACNAHARSPREVPDRSGEVSEAREIPVCRPPDPNTKTPQYKPPPKACDAHCHIFGPADKYPYAPDRTYTPPDAPLERFIELQKTLGLERAVLVNASCHGTDNRVILDAIAQSGGRYRGVANVDRSITDAELERLDEGGIRGIRFNFVAHLGGTPDLDEFDELVKRIAPLGWHVVL